MALPTLDQSYDESQKQVQGYGNAEQSALSQAYQSAMGMATQNLTSMGLSGTTIAPSMREGYMKQYQQSLNQLGQQIQGMKLGVNQSYAGMGQAQQQLDTSRMLGLGQLGIQQQEANQRQNALSQQQANTPYASATFIPYSQWSGGQPEWGGMQGYMDAARNRIMGNQASGGSYGDLFG